MDKLDIIQSVKKHLGFDVEGNDIKSEIQGCVVKMTHPFIVLNWATSFSKTKPALERIGNKKTLIATSQIFHQENWLKEAIKWNVDMTSSEICCHVSMHKHIGSWDLVIIDEAHRNVEQWVNFLQQSDVKEIIILSATIPNDIKKRLYEFGKPFISTITSQMAVDWGVLPEPEINVQFLTLDNVYRNQIYEYGKDKSKKTVICDYNTFLKDYKYNSKKPNLKIQCTEQEWYNIHVDRMEYFKRLAIETGKPSIWNLHTQMGNKRKTFLASLKTKHVQKLINKLKEERVVVFANSIEQAVLFDKDAVHSKNKNGQVIIDEFNDGKRNKLISCKQLNESMNLVNPNYGIVVQLDGSKGNDTKINISGSQKLGRIFRSDVPVLYLFVYRNTQDENYWNDFRSTLNPNWINYIL